MTEKKNYSPWILRPLFLLLIFLAILFYLRNNEGELASLDHRGTESGFREEYKPFYHGVASGDPLTDRVIIWTRITPVGHGPQSVEWEVSLDPDFTSIIQNGVFITDSVRDYTVKVDVTGLDANTEYFYRFISGMDRSDTGRMRTAPGGNNPVRLVIVSCSNYEAGYYNVYRNISERKGLTAVVHLGDYIYELATGLYGDTSLEDRKHLPPGEIISLSDYRTRYAQYRLDPDLQAVHRNHPFVVIWDDHEIANNAFSEGALNHQDEEGSYSSRRTAAARAFYEWLPVRESENGNLYRNLYLSGQAELIMLDERLAGRTAQVSDTLDPAWRSADQQMLGKEQFQWLLDRLATSQARWKIIGNQVIFAELNKEAQFKDRPFNMDAWDGYPEERKRLLDFLKVGELKGVIFITGDTHASWAFEIPHRMSEYRQGDQKTVLAAELGTPSVTSANSDENLPVDSVRWIEDQLRSPFYNPHLKYVNMRDHGYLELMLDSSQATAVWHYTTSISRKDAGMFEAARLVLDRNTGRLSNFYK